MASLDLSELRTYAEEAVEQGTYTIGMEPFAVLCLLDAVHQASLVFKAAHRAHATRFRIENGVADIALDPRLPEDIRVRLRGLLREL